MEETLEYRVLQDLKDRQVQQDQQDPQDQQALQEIKALKEIRDLKETRDLKEIKDLREIKDLKVTKVQLGTKEHKEHKVQMVIGSPAHISSTTRTKLFFELLKLSLCMEHNYLAAACWQP